MTKTILRQQIREILLKINLLRILLKLLKKKERIEIEILIRKIAKEYGVDGNLAIRVAKCESDLNPKAKRWCGKYGYDRGIFQWNEFFHPEITDECAFDPECATKAFCKAVGENHLSWWSPSSKCWKI